MRVIALDGTMHRCARGFGGEGWPLRRATRCTHSRGRVNTLVSAPEGMRMRAP